MHESRRPTGRLVSLSAAGALALSALIVPPAVADSHNVVATTVDVVGITDFHGRIEANYGGGAAGAASIAAAVRTFREDNPNALFVSSGDNIGASTFTSFIQCDQPTIDALNAMGLQVSALGNHEFDNGRDDFDVRVMGEPGVPDPECPDPTPAAFPYLAANLYEAGTDVHAYDPYWTTEVDGVSVGFIGAMTEDLPSLVDSDGIASLRVGEIVPAVEAAVDDLTDGDDANGEAEIIVLLLHEAATDAILSGLPAEVDAVFAGHTHVARAEMVSVGGWEGAVVQAGAYSEHLAHVEFGLNSEGDLIHVDADVHQLVVGGEAVYPPIEAEASIVALVAAAVAAAEVPGAVELGRIGADFRRAVHATGENRGGESTLGNLVADVHLWAANDAGFPAQIAFMNPGGLRADMLVGDDGVVTYKDAALVQSFANTLMTIQLSGEQVVEVLEQQWQPEGSTRPFLKLGVSGLTYVYDPEAAAGERISQVWVEGVPLDLAATYSVAANSFLAAGGDNFTAFRQGTGLRDTGRVDLQAMVDFMAVFAPVDGDAMLMPDLAQRSVGVRVIDEPEAGYAAGDEVTVELSSLLFSAAEGQGDTVVLSIGDQEVASADIDPSVVDTTDEQGRATVTFALPAGLTGETATVDVTVPGSGTATAFTIGIVEAAAPPVVTPPAPPAEPAPPAAGRNPGLRVETGR